VARQSFMPISWPKESGLTEKRELEQKWNELKAKKVPDWAWGGHMLFVHWEEERNHEHFVKTDTLF
jgi:hypothetical protein